MLLFLGFNTSARYATIIGEKKRANFFVFLRPDCLGKMMYERVVIEVVVEVVVLVWWR